MNGHIAEHDVVVLTKDLPDGAGCAGDVGVVLALHAGSPQLPPGYTLEITTVTGETAAVVDVPAEYVRAAAATDIRHARTIRIH